MSNLVSQLSTERRHKIAVWSGRLESLEQRYMLAGDSITTQLAASPLYAEHGGSVEVIETLSSSLQAMPPVAANDNYRVRRDESLVTTLVADEPVQFIAAGSIWHYLATGSDPGPAWNDIAIDESTWAQGPAELGYSSVGNPPVTEVDFGPDPSSKYPTTYFRKSFTVADRDDFSSFLLRIKRDDGAAVWINGIERIRTGLPGKAGDSPIPYSFYSAPVADNGADFHTFAVNHAWLAEGPNTIAVEVHQGGPNSADLRFDLALEGTKRRSGVVANDNDRGLGPLSAVKPTDPLHGQLTQFNADGTFTYVANPGFTGLDTFTYKATDLNLAESNVATVSIIVLPKRTATVFGRHIFYNASRYDNNQIGIGTLDANAIATDKAPLLPGQTATFANYTSYSKGINGLIVEFEDLGAIDVDDFEFRVGNDNTPDDWVVLAQTPEIGYFWTSATPTVMRITLTFPNNLISNEWLEVTIKANEQNHLASPDVFYFGNAIGESGNSQRDARVTVSDEVAARNNPYTDPINPAPITNRWDYNRDGRVTVSDQVIARNNLTAMANRLQLISIPIPLHSSPATHSALTAQHQVDATREGDDAGAAAGSRRDLFGRRISIASHA